MSDKKTSIINLTKRPIMRACESFVELSKIANIHEEDRSFHDVTLIELDAMSRNRSVYDSESYKTSWEESFFVQEQLKADTFFGELGHPDPECSQDRFMTVDMNNISHKIRDHRYENGNIVKGTIKLHKPKGDIVWDWVTGGSNIAVSIRVLTPTYVKKKDQQGREYIFKYGKFMPISYDIVLIGGFYNAKIADADKYDARQFSSEALRLNTKTNNFKEEVIKKYNLSREEVDRMFYTDKSAYSQESYLKSSDLKSILKSEETVRRLEDLYGFSLENTDILMLDDQVRININSKESVYIPINTYIVNSIFNSIK